MNQTERESTNDQAKARRTSPVTIFAWVFGVGILLMILAYLGGFLTMGGPNAENRMGAVSTQDSAMITKSDTTIGQ